MLTAALIAFLLTRGGGTIGFGAELERATKAVKQEVTVDSTRSKALAILDQADKENKAFAEQQKTASESLSKVLADRGATAAQIDSALGPMMASDSTLVSDMVGATFELRRVLTAAEWAKVFPPPAAKGSGAKP